MLGNVSVLYNLPEAGPEALFLLEWGFPKGDRNMAKVCDVCGKGPRFGNKISHAHNVSKRRWNVNLQRVRAVVNRGNTWLRVCTSCIRSGKVAKA
jgi:large subunit ribosomal protein L28